MSKTGYVFALVLFFSLAGCRKKEISVDIPVIRVAEKIETIVDTPLFGGFTVTVFKNTYLGGVDRIIAFDDKLFVLDKQQNRIAIFDNEGNYLNEIKRLGRASGEYISLTDFAIDSSREQLVLYSDKPYKLLYFNPEGEYLREVRLEQLFFNMGALQGTVYATYPQSDGARMVAAVDSLGETRFSSARKNNFPLGIGTIGNRIVHTKALNWAEYFDNHIYTVSDGKVVPKYRLDFGEHNLPGIYLTKEGVSAGEFDNDCFENKYVYDIVDISESDHFMFFKSNLPGFYIYSKKTDRCVHVNFLNVPSEKIILNRYIPIEGGGNRIGFIMPFDALQSYRDLKDQGRISENPLMETLCRENAETDNPVLFAFEIQ